MQKNKALFSAPDSLLNKKSPILDVRSGGLLGIKEQLTRVWEGLEDGYYGVLESLDAHGIPVFKVTDPIDAHVPSFLLVLILAVAAIAGAFIYLNPSASGPVQNRIVFVDTAQQPLVGVSVELQSTEFSKKIVTEKDGEIRFELTPGSRVQVKATKAGFNSAEESFIVSENGIDQSVELLALSESETFFIQFAGPDYKIITGKKIGFALSCSNPEGALDKTDFQIDSDQKTELTRPKNCGTLLVTIKSPNEYKLISYPVSPAQPLIRLQEAGIEPDVQLGKLLVLVSSAQSGLLSDSQAVAVLFLNNRFQKQLPVINGSAAFTGLLPATYSVLVSDRQNRFSQFLTENIEVNAGEETRQTIFVSSQAALTINAQVQNSADQSAISNATIRLVEKHSNRVVGQSQSGADGKAKLILEHDSAEEIQLAVFADGFFSATTDWNPVESVQTIFLKPKTAGENGRVNVSVQNEAGTPLENAQIFLSSEEGTVRQDIAPVFSDAQGNAVFTGVPAGKYRAWSQKGFDAGESDVFSANEIDDASVAIIIKPGNATLEIFAASEQQIPVANAKVSVFDLQNQLVAELSLDETGHQTVQLQAGKSIRIEITSPEFLTYRSAGISLFSKTVSKINAQMQSKEGHSNFEIRFKEFQTVSAKTAERLIPGDFYYANFEMTIPENSSFSKTGFMVRLEPLLSADDWRIQSARFPQGIAIMGKAFSPPNGEKNDLALANLVSFNGSWVKIEFFNLSPGTYPISIGFKTRKDLASNTKLKLHYHAFAKTKEEGKWTTLPADSTVADGAKSVLYSTSFEQEALLGSSLDECIQSLCFSDFSVKETTGDSWLAYPFELKNNREYEFWFSVTAAGSEEKQPVSFSFSNIQQLLSVREIQIASYSIQPPDQPQIDGIVNDFSAGPIEFDVSKKPTLVRLVLKPQASQWSQLGMQFVVSNGPAIQKNVDFLSAGQNQFSVQLYPSEIPSMTSLPLVITVSDQVAGTAVADAFVTLETFSQDQSSASQTQTTGTDGKAQFLIPMLSPETMLKITVAKNGFETYVLEQPIGVLLAFLPDHLQADLDFANHPGTVLPFTMKNQSSLNFQGSSAELSGSLDGVLNLDELKIALQKFSGTILAAQNSVPTEFFSVELSPDLYLSEDTAFEAGLLLHFNQVDSKQAEFVFALPVTFNVKATNGLNATAATCLVVTPTVWNGVLQQNQSTLVITITNQCASDTGDGIDFNSLDSRIEWPTPALGNVEFQIQNADNEESSVTLKTGEWQSVLNDFKFSNTKTATLVFTPTSDTLGQTAEFNVVVSGKTKNGARFVAAPIASRLLIANLKDCLVFDPKPRDGVTVPFGAEGTFTIDASQCGNLTLDIALCQDDAGCSGGATKGTIDVSPTEFSLSQESPSQTITVNGNDLPGAYGITVFARSQDQTFTPVALVDTWIENDPTKYFALNKFEFFVKNNGVDSATLTNTHVSKPVTVSAPAKVWAQIDSPDENGLRGAQLAGDGLDPNAIETLEPALGQSRNAAQQLAGQVADSLDQASKSADNAQQQQNKASEETKKAKDAAKTALDGADKAVGLGQLLLTNCTPLITCAATPLSLVACPTGKAEAAKICATAQSLFGGLAQGIQPALSSADAAMKAADSAQGAANAVGAGATGIAAPNSAIKPMSAFFSILKNAISRASFQSSSTAVGEATTAQSQINQAQTDAAIGTSSQTSAGAASASQQAQNSCNSNNSAANLSKQAQEKTGEAGQNNTSAISGLGQNIAHAALFETAMSATCLTTVCSGPLTQLRTSFYTFKAAQTGLQGASVASNDQAKDNAKPQQQQAEQASKAAAGLACEASKRLREFADATPSVSEQSGDTNDEINQNLTNAANAQGLTDGLTNGIYKDEILNNVFTGYLINLVKDSKEIKTDNSKLTGKFNVEHAKVSNHYKEQEVGVVFKNSGLESDKPVYATVTITATEHSYSEPQSVPLGVTDFGAFRLEKIGSQSDYAQEFHLKFNSSENAESDFGVGATENRCVQGALIGQTTASALPKIKLSWKWADIEKDFCDAQNPDYKYCDATQLAIVVSKRLNKLDEFLLANGELPCPENPYEPKLQTQLDELNPQLAKNGITPLSADAGITKCWIPKTTDKLDGRPALSYYVQANAGAIHWTPDIPDVAALESLLNFDAYLIQDGYSKDFVKDFSDYYTKLNFSDTPSFFYDGSSGPSQYRFFDKEKISFAQKFTDSAVAPTSGLFKVNLVADFGEKWRFFDQQNQPSATIRVDALAFKQTALNSPFYYLPFDGQVGLEGNKLSRQGYGSAFHVGQNAVFLISRQTSIATVGDSGSKAIQKVNISRTNKLQTLNSQPSKRGIIFDLESIGNDEKQIGFSPSIATPVLLKISKQATPKPFSVFYDVRNSGASETTDKTLAFWTGAGACKDFSGDLVTSAFQEKPDRKALETDDLETWETAYAIDWPNALVGGDEYLKTIFYTPVSSAYALNSQSDHSVFATPDQDFQAAVDLQGIQNMPFNRKGQTETDRITALDDLFNLVEAGQVCVTNTGQQTRFWWNNDALYRQTGNSGKSIRQIEDGLQSLTSCIG